MTTGRGEARRGRGRSTATGKDRAVDGLFVCEGPQPYDINNPIDPSLSYPTNACNAAVPSETLIASGAELRCLQRGERKGQRDNGKLFAVAHLDHVIIRIMEEELIDPNSTFRDHCGHVADSHLVEPLLHSSHVSTLPFNEFISRRSVKRNECKPCNPHLERYVVGFRIDLRWLRHCFRTLHQVDADSVIVEPASSNKRESLAMLAGGLRAELLVSYHAPWKSKDEGRRISWNPSTSS